MMIARAKHKPDRNIYERAFESPIRYGLASAGGVILFISVFGFTLLNYLNGRRQDAA